MCKEHLVLLNIYSNMLHILNHYCTQSIKLRHLSYRGTSFYMPSSKKFAASTAERLLCLGQTSVSGLPEITWGGWTTMCFRALQCNILMFMLFSSMCSVGYVTIVLHFVTKLSNKWLNLWSSMSSSFLQPSFTSCIAEMLCSAHCCNSLPDVNSELIFLRRSKHKASRTY